MGFDILWLNEDGTELKDVPLAFTHRYVDRQIFWRLSLEEAKFKYDCKCLASGERGSHLPYCDDEGRSRPENFPRFYQLLKQNGLLKFPFKEMAIYLEQHPRIWLSFSC